MSDLVESLNAGHDLVEVIARVNPFDVKMGPIPSVVPELRDSGRTFAGGRTVLQERLDAFVSDDKERIDAWCNNYFHLADAGIVYEGMVKFQFDSPLLTGIMGIVSHGGITYVAIDADAVSKAVNGNMKHFKVSSSETVFYGSSTKTVQNVVLLPYANPTHIELSPDQFDSVAVGVMNRKDFIHGRDMAEAEIVNEGKVIHPVYLALYPESLMVDLVRKTFARAKKEDGYDTNRGIYLPSEPNSPRLRALCVDGLGYWSRLYGNY